MRATTDPAEAAGPSPFNGAWLRGQAPGWFVPASAGLSLIEAGLIVAQAGLIAWLAERLFIEGAVLAAAEAALLWLLAVLVARALAGGGRGAMAAVASARGRLGLREKLLSVLSRAAPDPARSTGAETAAYCEQIDALDGYYSRFLPQAIAALVIPAAILVAVFLLDPIAGLALLVAGPLIPAFMVLIGLGAARLSQDQHRALARLGGWFLDRLQGAETLKLFRAGPRELERVAEMTDSLRQRTMKVLRVAFLSSAVLEFLSAVAIASLAIYIGLGLLGALDFGPAKDLTLFSGLFILLLAPEYFAPIRQLSQGWHDRADARGAIEELSPLLAFEPARETASGEAPPAASGALAVSIRGLDLTWPGREAVFEGLDLEIPAGQKLVLIGPSGGGKSSLIGLLAGFRGADAGQILYDGIAIERLDEEALSQRVAWLGQQPVLFAGSLSGNIRMGWPEASDEAVAEIAEKARVMEFARRLPEGLDAPVGEGGFGLSGGQAQRVALARALIRPRPLVLLDEPTAGLDPKSETLILQALEELIARREFTLVMASHRRSVAEWADRVLEVGGGGVREVAR